MKKYGSRFIFQGLFFLFSGFILLLSTLDFIPYSIGQIWPVLVCFCGIALVLSGFYPRKNLSISFLVPSVGLFGLGLFFLLFSLDLIKERFSVFIARWWPASLIILGIVLLALFFYRRKAAQGAAKVSPGDS